MHHPAEAFDEGTGRQEHPELFDAVSFGVAP
jgi:hypothetical protein